MTWELVAMIAVLAVVAAFIAIVIIAIIQEGNKDEDKRKDREHQRWMEREELKMRKTEHDTE